MHTWILRAAEPQRPSLSADLAATELETKHIGPASCSPCSESHNAERKHRPQSHCYGTAIWFFTEMMGWRGTRDVPSHSCSRDPFHWLREEKTQIFFFQNSTIFYTSVKNTVLPSLVCDRKLLWFSAFIFWELWTVFLLLLRKHLQ